MKNKRVLPALLGSVALTLGLVTVSTSINKEVVNAAEETITVSTNISDYAVENGWANATQYTTIEMDDVVSVTATGGGNTGKYYTSGTNWRIYQTENPTVEISVIEGYQLSTVKITYSSSNTGVLTYGGNNITSGTVVNDIEMTSISFGVGNTGSATNGQVRITQISVSYVEVVGDSPEEPLYAKSQDIHDVMGDFYNKGTYTKKTEIFLNDDALTEIAEHFHGPVQQDRTTYYTTEDGKEALYMADLDGTITEINSGYSTVNESNIEAVRGKFSSVVEGNMAHFKYNRETEKAEYDYIVKTTDGIAGYYHALDEMFAQDYFGDTAWVVNTNKTFEHTVTGANDAYLEFFLAFAAPCLKSSILTDSNYITVDGMKLVIGTGKNDLNNKEYLSLKMVLVEDKTNKGLVDNVGMILTEARIYPGNEMFTEKVATNSITSTLTQSFIGVSGTSYVSWSDKKDENGIIFSGQSAGGNDSIQLRSKNSNSGIIVNTSGNYKVKKITVVWNSNTVSGRSLDIYGKASAYTNPTDLYNSSTQGTKLGSIVCGTSTTLEVNGDYTYIAFRSKSDAMYISSITIEWVSVN